MDSETGLIAVVCDAILKRPCPYFLAIELEAIAIRSKDATRGSWPYY